MVLGTLIYITELPSNPAGVFNWFGLVLAAGIYWSLKKWKKHPVVYIGASAAIGIIAGYMGLFS